MVTDERLKRLCVQRMRGEVPFCDMTISDTRTALGELLDEVQRLQARVASIREQACNTCTADWQGACDGCPAGPEKEATDGN